MLDLGAEQAAYQRAALAITTEAGRVADGWAAKQRAMLEIYLRKRAADYTEQEAEDIRHAHERCLSKFRLAMLGLEQLWALGCARRDSLLGEDTGSAAALPMAIPHGR